VADVTDDFCMGNQVITAALPLIEHLLDQTSSQVRLLASCFLACN